MSSGTAPLPLACRLGTQAALGPPGFKDKCCVKVVQRPGVGGGVATGGGSRAAAPVVVSSRPRDVASRRPCCEALTALRDELRGATRRVLQCGPRSHAARRPAGTEGPMRPGMAAWRGGRPAAGGGPTGSTSEVSQSVRGPELWAGRRAAEVAAQASLAIPARPASRKAGLCPRCPPGPGTVAWGGVC